MAKIAFPLGTGQVCALLQTPEFRLVNLCRAGKLTVANIGGRRLWYSDQVLKAACLLDKATPEIRNLCATPPAAIVEGSAAK